jgi:hypothetical protein
VLGVPLYLSVGTKVCVEVLVPPCQWTLEVASNPNVKENEYPCGFAGEYGAR